MQMKMVTVGLVWLFLSHMTVAQATQQGAEGSAGKIRLDNGTEVRLLLMDAISSKTAKAGDSIRLRVLDDVKVDNLVIIANRAPAMATIAATQSARRAWRTGSLAIRMDFVTLVDHQNQAIQAERVAKGTAIHPDQEWPTLILVSSGLAAFLLPFSPLQHGNQAILPKGIVFTAATSGEVLLDRSVVEVTQPVTTKRRGAASVTVYYPYPAEPMYTGEEASRLQVWCGQVRVAKVRRGHKFSLELPAGKYNFRGSMGAPISLQAEDGGEYYLKAAHPRKYGEIGVSFDLLLMEHDVGEVESADLTPLKAKDVPKIDKMDLALLQTETPPKW